METACLSTAAADGLRAARAALRTRFIHVLNLTPGRRCRTKSSRDWPICLATALR